MASLPDPMPFQLDKAAERLRQTHGDSFAFRHTMLDLLFASGCSVGEQAVALDGGDAMCVRASGPSAPSLAPALVVIVVDLDPPHLSGVTLRLGQPARWPVGMSSLGGPAVAIGWAAIVQALCRSHSQRSWSVLYLRGPALGLGDYARDILADLPADAELVQVVPSVPAAAAEPDTADIARLDLLRSRNVWRFPACQHSYALAADLPWGEAFSAFQSLLAGLGRDVAWTLHDLHLYHGASSHLAAVLRTSAPVRLDRPGFRAAEVEAGKRLMFPVNDALAALDQLPDRLPPGWTRGIASPLHVHALPDGLRLYAVVPPGGSAVDLPDHAGNLSLRWDLEPMAVRPTLAVLPMAVGAAERLGPVPPGAVGQGAVVWQLPLLGADEEFDGLARALAHAVA